MKFRLLVALLGLGVLCDCSRDLVEVRQEAQPDPPEIERFTPLAGLAGQTVVKIEGRHFPSDARVYFGSMEGVWAVGPEYEYSDTVTFAIPPFGSPAQVEISVRASNGEARAQNLFLVFDSEPEISELSTDRVTRDTELIIRGRSFNASDRDARLLLGDQQIYGLAVALDQMTADLGSTASFAAVGAGWKFLRYEFTPYVDGGANETAVPVFVVQPPVIVDAEAEVFSRGVLQLLVRGYDSYHGWGSGSVADNSLVVGGQRATILEAYATAQDPKIARVMVRLPELAVGRSLPVVLENLAGASNDGSGADWWVRVRGPGETSDEPRIIECAGRGPAHDWSSSWSYQDLRQRRQRHAVVIPGASSWYETIPDALAVETMAGAYAVWKREQLGSGLDPFFIHRVAYLDGSQAVPAAPSFFAALATNAPRGGTVAATEWELLLVRGLESCRIPLSAVTQPSYTGERLPEFLAPDPREPSTTGIWFRGHGGDNDQVLVVHLPADMSGCFAAAVSEVSLGRQVDLVALAHASGSTYIAAAAGGSPGEAIGFVVSDAGVVTALANTISSLRKPVALARQNGNSFSLVDTLDARIYRIQGVDFSFASSGLGNTGLYDCEDAVLASDEWWLGCGGTVVVQSVYGGPHAELSLAADFALQRFASHPWNGVRWAVMSSYETGLLVGLARPGEQVVSDYQVEIPVRDAARAAWFDEDSGNLRVYYPEDVAEFRPQLRNVQLTRPRLVIRDVAQAVGEHSFAAAITNHAVDPSVDPLALSGTVARFETNWLGAQTLRASEDVLFDSHSASTGYPVQLTAFSGRERDRESRLLAAVHRVDEEHEYLDLVELSPNLVEAPHCTLASITRAKPQGHSWLQALGTNGMKVEMWVVEDRGLASTRSDHFSVLGYRLLVSLTGDNWSGLYALPLPWFSELSGNCPASPAVLDSLWPAANGTLVDVSVDPHGRRLAALTDTGEIYIATLAGLADVPAALTPVALKLSCWDYGASTPAAVVATSRGVVLVRRDELCAAAVPEGFTGGTVSDPLFVSSLPFYCDWSGRFIVEAARSPNERELWIAPTCMDSSSNEVPQPDSFYCYSLETGADCGSVQLDEGRFATGMRYSSDGSTLELLTIGGMSHGSRDLPRVLAAGGTDVCSVR